MKTSELLIAALILTTSMPLRAMGDVSFDKLSDCQGLKAVHILVSAPISSSCRSPHDTLEVKLMTQFLLMPKGRACLLPSAPTTRLNGFSCVQTFYSGDGELACFRLIDKRSVDKYFENYKSQYRAMALAYEEAADRCENGNQDATPVGPDLFPSIFLGIGKPLIGFVLGIGKGLTTRSRAYHGFAELDPELNANPANALEVFQIFQVSSSVAASPPIASVQKSGVLQLEIIKKNQAVADYEKLMSKKTQMPVFVEFRMISVKYVGSNERSNTEKRNDLERWQRGMTAIVRQNGFRRLTQYELSKAPFHSQDEMRDLMIHNLPFGSRDITGGEMGRHPDFLLRGEDNDDCGQSVEIMSIMPVEGVHEDYGGFGMVSFSIGCEDEKVPEMRKCIFPDRYSVGAPHLVTAGSLMSELTLLIEEADSGMISEHLRRRYDCDAARLWLRRAEFIT